MPINEFNVSGAEFNVSGVEFNVDAFLPTDLGASLIAWYDANDPSTVTESSGQVTDWADKGANGYDLDMNNNTPEWGLGAQINGRNVMHYEGTFDELYGTSGVNFDLTQFAMITVGQTQNTGDTPAYGAMLSTDEVDKIEFRAQRQTTQGRLTSALKIDGTSYTANTTSSPLMADLTPYLATFWYDGFEMVQRVNGGAVTATNASVPDGGTLTINRIQVGRESNTPRNYQGELIILNTATLASVEKAEGFLAHKWFMTGLLPGGHPYKTAEPKT